MICTPTPHNLHCVPMHQRRRAGGVIAGLQGREAGDDAGERGPAETSRDMRVLRCFAPPAARRKPQNIHKRSSAFHNRVIRISTTTTCSLKQREFYKGVDGFVLHVEGTPEGGGWHRPRHCTSTRARAASERERHAVSECRYNSTHRHES